MVSKKTPAFFSESAAAGVDDDLGMIDDFANFANAVTNIHVFGSGQAGVVAADFFIGGFSDCKVHTHSLIVFEGTIDKQI